MKKSSNLFGTFLLAVFLLTNVYAQPTRTSQIRPRTSDEIQTSRPTKAVTTEKVEQDMAEALTLIEDNHVGGKNLDYNDLFKSSIDSMLHTLDPHSNYFDAKEYEEFRINQNSQYFGIGAILGDLRDKDGKVIATFIKATFEGAPANRAGLRYGDKIVDVNGTSMLGKSFVEVRNFLIGPRGTNAKITVERYGTGSRDTVNIVRDAVSQPSIPEASMIRPGVGYIAMTGGFHQTTYAEFRQAMAELKAQGMEQLVLDLRNNPGGLVSQAYQVANTFLSRGQKVLTQRGRIQGAESSLAAENNSPDKTPIVVLVNRNSASASEILAGALQDHDRALIVGESTYGKGLVQNPFPLEYGSMLLLTIAKYETPSGRLVQRDYSDGNLYNYLTDGGSLRDDTVPEKPKGAASKTDSGRTVYSGGGIGPDETVKAETITIEKARFQQRLNSPIFAFTLQIAFGQIKGFESYKIDRPISFEYNLKKTDFPVTENLFQTFKKFAAEKYNFTPAQVDRERQFVERILRTELVTAAYGSTTSYQVFYDYDTQLKKAVELLPEARQLAIEGAKANAQKLKSEVNR
ncbi:MAG: S41 family peptidase [Acidobacteriota bacterium]|nr:S41 family peptidase [Acidobacteriota bacterium]